MDLYYLDEEGRRFCFFIYHLDIIVLFCLCNLSLLTWLSRKKGIVFALKSFLFLIIDVPVVVLGMIWGAAGFIAGYKY